MTLNAVECGGELGCAGSSRWAYVPGEGTVHIPFPAELAAGDVAALVARADRLGARSTALWLEEDERLPWLSEFGFDWGWHPWWMTAAPSDVPVIRQSRVRLASRVREHDQGRAHLLNRPDVFLAEAAVDGRYAGRAWLHVADDIAGIYDMEVWPGFRRQGLGRELIGLLVDAAVRSGARVVTLNATPEGALLYRTCGFSLVGAGRTYWRHRRNRKGPHRIPPAQVFVD
jgi:GNAT superfamily N-acetyltransferase